MKLIKRYANRKLYDTSKSCYVTISNIAEMVQNGEEVKIVDNDSGEDITGIIMARVLVKLENDHKGETQHRLLHDLIENSPWRFIQRKGQDIKDEIERKIKPEVSEMFQNLVELSTNSIESVSKRVEDSLIQSFPILKEIGTYRKRIEALEKEIQSLKERLNAVEKDESS